MWVKDKSLRFVAASFSIVWGVIFIAIFIMAAVFVLTLWPNLITILLLDPLKGVTWGLILVFAAVSVVVTIISLVGRGMGSVCMGFLPGRYQELTFYARFPRFWLGLLLDVILFPISFGIFLFSGRFLGDMLTGLSFKKIARSRLAGCISFFSIVFVTGAFMISSFTRFKYKLGLIVPVQARGEFIRYAVEISPTILNYWPRLMGVVDKKELCLTGVAEKNPNILDVCLEVDKELEEFGREFVYSDPYLWCNKASRSICDTYLGRLWEYLKSDSGRRDEYIGYFLKALVSIKGLSSYNELFSEYLDKVGSLDLKRVDVSVARRIYVYLRELLEFEDYLDTLLYWERLTHSDSAWLYFAIGEAYYLKQKDSDAKAYFAKAIVIDEGYREKVKLYYPDWE